MLKQIINFIHSKLIQIPRTTELSVALRCFRSDPTAVLPSKAHVGYFEDAAFDLYGPNRDQSYFLQPNERRMIDTCVSFLIPDGYWLKLRERSGLASKGIHVIGGVIDSGYSGRIQVILYNSSKEPVNIPVDKAICQFTVEKLTKATIEEIDFRTFEVCASNRQRGIKGFGSSDVK